MLNFFKVTFIVTLLLTAGCSTQMQVAENQQIQQSKSGSAQLVFLRSSFVGSAISSTVYEVTDGNIKFIGILNNQTKVTFSTSPGKKRFMIVGENADFMEANVKAGKTYFAIATPRMGAWKARFSLWPIKNSSSAKFNHNQDGVKSMIKSTKLVQNTPKSRKWYEENKESITSLHDKYIKKWNEWTKENLAKRTLAPSDHL